MVEALVHPTSAEIQILNTRIVRRAVHKYMPVEMSLEERLETFAARQHTLDYLIKFVREQGSALSLNSVLITGPRGAGKTTLERIALGWNREQRHPRA